MGSLDGLELLKIGGDEATAAKPFESGFPYGHDRWISSCGTAWAALTMTKAIQSPVRRAAR
jgi:hypothetical protein